MPWYGLNSFFQTKFSVLKIWELLFGIAPELSSFAISEAVNMISSGATSDENFEKRSMTSVSVIA